MYPLLARGWPGQDLWSYTCCKSEGDNQPSLHPQGVPSPPWQRRVGGKAHTPVSLQSMARPWCPPWSRHCPRLSLWRHFEAEHSCFGGTLPRASCGALLGRYRTNRHFHCDWHPYQPHHVPRYYSSVLLCVWHPSLTFHVCPSVHARLG